MYYCAQKIALLELSVEANTIRARAERTLRNYRAAKESELRALRLELELATEAARESVKVGYPARPRRLGTPETLNSRDGSLAQLLILDAPLPVYSGKIMPH